MEDNIFDKTGEYDKIQEVDLKERMEKLKNENKANIA